MSTLISKQFYGITNACLLILTKCHLRFLHSIWEVVCDTPVNFVHLPFSTFFWYLGKLLKGKLRFLKKSHHQQSEVIRRCSLRTSRKIILEINNLPTAEKVGKCSLPFILPNDCINIFQFCRPTAEKWGYKFGGNTWPCAPGLLASASLPDQRMQTQVWTLTSLSSICLGLGYNISFLLS